MTVIVDIGSIAMMYPGEAAASACLPFCCFRVDRLLVGMLVGCFSNHCLSFCLFSTLSFVVSLYLYRLLALAGWKAAAATSVVHDIESNFHRHHLTIS
jgi:hypothetical protein